MSMNPRTHPRGARPDFTLPRPNLNPSVMTDALWWMVCMCEALEPASANGGTYANKAGSHNIGANLPDFGEGNIRTDHSIRHAWNRTGPWWRSKTAGRDWTFPDAQRGDYRTINRYTRRIIAAMADPSDTRTDRALFYVLGNTDGDVQTEGYNEIRDGTESSGDDTHAWHIHESWLRDAVGSYWKMWAVLTVYMGWTYAEWLESVKPEVVVTDQFSTADEAILQREATEGVLAYSGNGRPVNGEPAHINSTSNVLAYFTQLCNQVAAQRLDLIDVNEKLTVVLEKLDQLLAAHPAQPTPPSGSTP